MATTVPDEVFNYTFGGGVGGLVKLNEFDDDSAPLPDFSISISAFLKLSFNRPRSSKRLSFPNHRCLCRVTSGTSTPGQDSFKQ